MRPAGALLLLGAVCAGASDDDDKTASMMRGHIGWTDQQRDMLKLQKGQICESDPRANPNQATADVHPLRWGAACLADPARFGDPQMAPTPNAGSPECTGPGRCNWCGQKAVCCKAGEATDNGECDGNIGGRIPMSPWNLSRAEWTDTWHACVCMLPPTPTVDGDPFVTNKDGQRVQFYLPLGEDVQLLKCAGVTIYGRVVGSSVAADTQQWFDRFRVDVAGHELASVERNFTARLLDASVSEQSAAAAAGDGVDIARPASGAVVMTPSMRKAAATYQGKLAEDSVDRHLWQQMLMEQVQVEQDPALPAAQREEEMRALKKLFATAEDRAGLGVPLTTLRVRAGGKGVARTADMIFPTPHGDAAIAVAQSKVTRVGSGFSESVSISVGSMDLEIVSAVASKFEDAADGVRHMHLDLRLRHIPNEGECKGILPELWGTIPMSKATVGLLLPSKKTA